MVNDFSLKINELDNGMYYQFYSCAGLVEISLIMVNKILIVVNSTHIFLEQIQKRGSSINFCVS